MATAKKCDRCGAFYDEKEKKFKINKNGAHVLSWIKLIDTNDMLITYFDLCEQCMKDLWHWLCNEEEVECEVDE